MRFTDLDITLILITVFTTYTEKIHVCTYASHVQTLVSYLEKMLVMLQENNNSIHKLKYIPADWTR